MIRISEPQLGPEVERLVLEVLRSGRLAQGPMVERFEALCAKMAEAPFAVAVSNGTAALDAALEARGIGPGDEVITTPLTFAATLNALLRAGTRIRFADVGADFTIDPDSVRSLIGPSTSALLPVHLYGLPADMRQLREIAAEYGLKIIEDAAQAHGASSEAGKVGAEGTATFSFYATKNVTAGEGGVVTTDDRSVVDHLRLIRNQGMSEPYRYSTVGQNLRMTELQAAVAIPQLERLADFNTARARNAAVLTAGLAECEDLTLPTTPQRRTHVWHQYTVLLDRGRDRDAVVAGLAKRGVQAGIYYPALVWDHPPYRQSDQVIPDRTPQAADVVERCFSLPVHPGLQESDLAIIIEAVSDVLDKERSRRPLQSRGAERGRV